MCFKWILEYSYILRKDKSYLEISATWYLEDLRTNANILPWIHSPMRKFVPDGENAILIVHNVSLLLSGTLLLFVSSGNNRFNSLLIKKLRAFFHISILNFQKRNRRIPTSKRRAHNLRYCGSVICRGDERITIIISLVTFLTILLY